MKVALYARVSSEKQAEKDLSISSQLKALRKYAKQKDWTICKEFVDEAESARTANRPQFQEMIAYARKKSNPFEAIIIWKHSRFARNREDAVIYKSLLRRHGVSVVSINEQVDDTPAGKLLEGIIEVIDEFYSLNLAEDTIRGMRENASRGFKNGSIPIGYKAKKVMDGHNQRTKLEPDEFYAPVVKRIFHMYLNNKGIKKIANTLNVEGLKTNKGKPWSNSTISYILKNEVYTGTLVFGKTSRNHFNRNNPTDIIRVKDCHTSIVPKETFDSIQTLLFSRRRESRHPREINSLYRLSGLVFCGKCGAKMIGRSAKSGKYHYYACHNYSKCGKSICDMKQINKEQIEKLVINRLKTHVLTEKNLKSLLNIIIDETKQSKRVLEQQLITINKQIEKTNARLGKLYDSLETGRLDVEDLAPRIKELRMQIEELQTQKRQKLEKSEDSQHIPIDYGMLKEYVNDLNELLAKGSLMEQKAFLRSFIKKIIVNHPDVTIEYTFPIDNDLGNSGKSEVLPIKQTGSPGRT